MAEEKQKDVFGIIEFPGGAFSCTIHDRSESLAVLEVPDSADIPDEFDLFIHGERFRCRALWREEQRIGIRFV